MSIYTQVQKNMNHYYELLKKQYSAKYVKEALLGIGIILSLFGGYFLHDYYVKHREEKAFGALIEVVESFEKAQYAAMGAGVDKKKIEEEWSDVETLLDSLYHDNMGSYLAPYFMMFKAQIELEKGGSPDIARETITKELGNIPQGSELFSLFDLKRIKLGFDSKDNKVREESLKSLEMIAKDKTSYVYEEAAYLLGAYYMHKGQSDKAHEIWKELVKDADKTALLESPWVKQAEEKLGSVK